MQRLGAARGLRPHVLEALVVAGLVLSLAAAAFWFEKQRHRERAIVATSNMAALLEDALSISVDKVDAALEAARFFYENRAAAGLQTRDAQNDYLARLASISPLFGAVSIADRAGIVRYGPGVARERPRQVADAAFFRRLAATSGNELVIDGPVASVSGERWTMFFAKPLRDTQGAFVGAVFSAVDTRQFQDILASASLGQYGAATIRTDDLALVQRVPDPRNAVGSREVSDQLRAAIAANPQAGAYVAETALDGIERINAYRKVGHAPLYVIVGLATRDYLGNWVQNVLVIAVLALLAIAAGMLAAYRNYKAQSLLAGHVEELTRMGDELRDLLEQRRVLADQLGMRAREAEAANVAKSAFLANVSHEMRTPLNHVLGLAYLVRAEPLTPKQAAYLASIEQAGRHLNDLIVTVLEMTRVEGENLALCNDPVDLAKIVDNAVSAVMSEASKKNLRLEIQEVPKLERVHGDAQHILWALKNYVSNAVRFTPAGKISLRITARENPDDTVLVRFEVEDTGPGIDAEHLRRLFSAFEQGDNSLSREHEGLGLGLALTRKIAVAHGGDAGCDSVSGRGSVFWFSVKLKGGQA